MARVCNFTWIVPGGAANAPLASEAVRAGAWGFVELEDVRDAEVFRRDLAPLRADANVPLGFKWDASRREVWEPLIAGRPRYFIRVIPTRPSRSGDGIVAKGSEGAGRIGDETSFLLMLCLAGVIATPFSAQGDVGLDTATFCRAQVPAAPSSSGHFVWSRNCDPSSTSPRRAESSIGGT